MPHTAANSLQDFVPYGALHVVSVCGCALVIVAIVFLGRRLAGTPGEWRLRVALAVFALAYWIAYNTWWNWHGLDPATGLPLQTCDVSGLIAPFALLTQNRWLRATLYFWGIGFATQAFIQPTLTVGPAQLLYWAFWTAHTIIIAYAIYDLAVLGFRPDWSDLGRAAGSAALWAAVVLPVDLMLGANYGFIGNPPAGTAIPAFVEFLGPWPERLAIMLAIGLSGFVILLLPWLAVRRHARGAEAPARDRVEETGAA